MKLLIMALLFFYTPFWPMDVELLPGDPLIIINKHTNKLAWFDNGELKMEISVATGKNRDWTPEGLFTITVKAKQPYYRKMNIPGGDPRNPLGSRWIGFDAEGTDGRTYGLHGTNQPNSIGKYISQGCVRLAKEPLEVLYEEISNGTKILITDSALPFNQIARSKGVL